MDLTHSFTVPTSVDDTWAHFQDIGAIAECFPGAKVTSVGETDDGAPTFEGTCKVKLGPIALVYAGSGQFVERNESTHQFVVEAKGRDKRGNGTAGATVTVAMQSAGGGTVVEVLTDLSITGKPAQFGRGVMQDVSDKLLGQFVGCLEERLGTDDEEDQDAGPAVDPSDATPDPGADRDAGAEPVAPPVPSTGTPPQRPTPKATDPDDALDLGATVLPVLLRSYGKQVAVAVLVLLGLAVVVRALRRG